MDVTDVSVFILYIMCSLCYNEPSCTYILGSTSLVVAKLVYVYSITDKYVFVKLSMCRLSNNVAKMSICIYS